VCQQELLAASAGKESPQPREIDAQDRIDSPWGSVSPKLLDESLARDGLVRMHEKKAEERALFRTTEREYLLGPDDFDRPEDAKLEIRMPLRGAMVRPSFCERVRLVPVCSVYSSRLAAVLSGA
jgi:hypothetical protein